MKELVTDRFIINFEEGLEDFIEKSLKIVDERMPLIEETLDCKNIEIEKLKTVFFINRDNFVNYIKSISGGFAPPDNAVGCFYNSGIQCLVDLKDKENLKCRLHTLTHELVHIYIYKLIYQKYQIDRIKWFDESFAEYLSGYVNTLSLEEIKDFFNVNNIQRVEIVSSDMFMIIGKYLFENNLAKQYLEILKENPEEIKKIGKDVFLKALNWINNLE